MSSELLSSKLHELEKSYSQMKNRLHMCQEEAPEKLVSELRILKSEYKKNNCLLEQTVKSSRSPAVTALSNEQVLFFKRTENIMKYDLPKYLCSETADDTEAAAEAQALYAEYAIDFALQSIRYALIASMEALDTQNKLDRERKDLK